MKKKVLIIFSIAVCLIGFYAYYWYRYKSSMDEVNRTWYEKEYVGKEIKGVLKSINEFNGNPFEVVLTVKNQGDEFDISYGVTCVDREFVDFVEIGDSVIKSLGEKVMRFCKTENNCKDYELNFCNKFK